MTTFKIINNQVSINKEVTELDRFVIELISMIKKYAGYVIVSGYVSIFFGRARATEDIDVFIESIPLESFVKLFDELTEKGYELNEDDSKRLYFEYLDKGDTINIWKKDFPLLRLEMKFAQKKSQLIVLMNPLAVLLNDQYTLLFSNIELQIAYKRYVAKSGKDMEDARHLEVVFSPNKTKINYYKQIFLNENEKRH